MKRLLLLSLLPVAFTALAQPLPPPGATPDGGLPGPNAPGRFYGPTLIGGTAGIALSNANRLIAMPVYIRPGSVLKTLSFNITTGNAAAWNARLCLYADSGQGLPGALLSDPGTIAVGSGSITGAQTATIPGGGIAVGGKWYWLAFNADSTAESISQAANASVGVYSGTRLLGFGSLANALIQAQTTLSVWANQTFGACPAVFPAANFGDNLTAPYIIIGF